MKLGKREELLLFKLLEFSMHRYLLTFVRKQGHERAERHIEFSKLLWECREIKTAGPEDHREWMKVHDLIADKVTNHLPKTIGLDLDEEHQEWDILVDKLFRKCVAIV